MTLQSKVIKMIAISVIFHNDYLSSEDKKKCIEIPAACELLNLVLGLQLRPQVNKLNNYLMVMNYTFLMQFCSCFLHRGSVFR